MRSILLLGIFCFSLPHPSHASDVHVALGQWQYSESAPRIQGFTATPMQSHASGQAIQLNLKHQWTSPELGYMRAHIQGIRSLAPAQEHWQLNTQQQSNTLQIQEAAVQSELGITQDHLDIGILASYQWHQQSRQYFIVNGVPTPVQGEPILETVQNIWLGLNLRYSAPTWGAEASWEIPTWVHTSNSMVQGIFTTTAGFRIHTALNYPIANSPWGIHITYDRREQGSEVLTQQWLWPKNRWQMLSLRLSFAWS